MRRVLAADVVAKSAAADIAASSKAEVESAGADKSDEGYAIYCIQLNFFSVILALVDNFICHPFDVDFDHSCSVTQYM